MQGCGLSIKHVLKKMLAVYYLLTSSQGWEIWYFVQSRRLCTAVTCVPRFTGEAGIDRTIGLNFGFSRLSTEILTCRPMAMLRLLSKPLIRTPISLFHQLSSRAMATANTPAFVRQGPCKP